MSVTEFVCLFQPVKQCRTMNNNAGKLFHYRITVSPPTNFLVRFCLFCKEREVAFTKMLSWWTLFSRMCIIGDINSWLLQSVFLHSLAGIALQYLSIILWLFIKFNTFLFSIVAIIIVYVFTALCRSCCVIVPCVCVWVVLLFSLSDWQTDSDRVRWPRVPVWRLLSLLPHTSH